MSLKNIMRKTIASFGAISIVFGNCSLCGIGLTQVIAENSSASAIKVELVNEKYVQYQYNKVEQVEEQEVGEQVAEEEVKGVAIQSKLSVYPEYNQDTYLPTESVEINFNLPVINGFLPEKANVVEASTKSTTGKDIDTNINQNYDSNSGLLTISYNNTPGENGNIYSIYNENTKDEFEIIYIYPAEAYTGNEEEIKIESSVNIKMLFRTENGSVMTEDTEGFELTQKDNIGDISTFGITKLENEIYKGFMYSNVENGTSYDTEFNTVSTFAVLNSGVVDEITMELKDAEFVLNDEEETKVSTNGSVVYKTTKISKAEFDRMLGEDGVLEIYNGETLVATVKYIEVSENEEIIKKLSVIHSDEDIRILSDEETIISVEYKEDITSLKIKISKPIAEGFIHFENKNAIKATEDYGYEVENIKYLGTEGVVNEYSSNVRIELLEPETKITVNSSNINFSTLQTNKTTLTINLDSTNASTKLFNNPIITVELPEGLINGNLSSPEIVNGNGLTIKKATADNNIITIELEGKQKSYDLTNVSGGASIVMDIENIDFNDTLPAHTDKIKVTCVQEDEIIDTSCNVNIVSKAGLLVLSKLSGFDNQNTTLISIDNGLKIVNIEKDDESKEIVQTIDLVNNYDDKITNLEIIGRLGYIGGDLNSNFDLEIIKEIEVENGKVYYSTNQDANYEDDSWTEEYINGAKAYKIEINNKELASKDSFGIKIYLNLPANLYYNQESYIKTDINYQYNNNSMNDSSIIGMLTEKNNLANNSSDFSAEIVNEEGENIPVSVIVTPNVTQSYVHSRQRITYNIKVTNNGTEDLNNIVIEDIIPSNAIYTYEAEIEGNAANYTKIVQDSEVKNKIWNIECLKSGETIELEIMFTMADISEEQEIVNTVVLKHNEESITAENKLTLKPAIIETSLTTNAEGMLGVVYNVGEEIQYYINVKNIHDEKLKDIKVQFELPSTLIYLDGGLATGNLTVGYTIEDQGNINNNIFEYNINKLKAGEEKTICIKAKVNQLTEGYEADIITIAQVNVSSEIYESNIKTIKTIQSGYKVNLSSNVSEETVLKQGNEVIYIIEVENVGAVSGSVTIKDSIPEQLKVKKVEEYENGELKKSLDTGKQDIEWRISSIEQGKKSTFKVITEVAKIEVEEVKNIEVINKATIIFGEREIISNETKIAIQPELKVVEENKEYNPTFTDKDEDNNKGENNNQTGDSTQEDNTNTGTEESKVYTISGVAWLDLDKNGKKSSEETLLQNITVSLINMEIGNFATDSNGNKITATTDSQGKYTFSNITNGSYAVMFEFDTETYTVTTYQKEGVVENENSDAILSTVNVNGEDKLVALTDKFELTSNKENIDLGLIENAIFDLSLNKQITEITVVDDQGTESYEYENGHTAKVDLVAKYMNGANVIVNYKFTITNEGEVAGYVNSLMDSLPSGLEFSSELNNNWYKGSDGNLYTTSLSGKTINPGESIDIDLVLTKTMTEENAGTFINSAKLEKISNLENIEEKEEAIENNESSAILIISIKTGTAILYIGITTLCLAIISIGVYFIKKKVLTRII